MAIAFDWGSGASLKVTDGVTNSGDNTVTSATASWSAVDIGKQIYIETGTPYSTYITAINSANSIEVAVAPGNTLTGVQLGWWVGNYLPTSTTTSLTWKHRTTGSNRYLVVAVWYAIDADDANLAATFNSVAMTLLHTYHQSGTRGGALFGLALEGVVATGEFDVVVYDTTVTAVSIAATSASYTGVHQTVSTGTAAHDGNGGTGGTTQTVTVTSATGEMVVDCLALNYQNYLETPTAPTVVGSTLRPSECKKGDFCGTNGQLVTGYTPGQASTTVTYTSGGTQYWAIMGIPLKPAAGGGSDGTVSAVFNVTP